ncbi:MAG: cold shock domain-containing protein [Myxococcales bacterium]|jgi:CspA family cold shock protein|nr:cold shock domain-containing protein [Myxococcales bacterium]
MLSLDDVEAGANCIHKNTKLRYSVVEVSPEEVLLAPETEGMTDLTVPLDLFLNEFAIGDRYSAPRNRSSRGRRGRRTQGPTVAPTGPKSRGRIKKMVRDRGFGFIRGDDGKEVFFHRSGLNGADYDALSEGDVVEYVIQEGPRGARAEHVKNVSAAA